MRQVIRLDPASPPLLLSATSYLPVDDELYMLSLCVALLTLLQDAAQIPAA